MRYRSFVLTAPLGELPGEEALEEAQKWLREEEKAYRERRIPQDALPRLLEAARAREGALAAWESGGGVGGGYVAKARRNRWSYPTTSLLLVLGAHGERSAYALFHTRAAVRSTGSPPEPLLPAPKELPEALGRELALLHGRLVARVPNLSRALSRLHPAPLFSGAVARGHALFLLWFGVVTPPPGRGGSPPPLLPPGGGESAGGPPAGPGRGPAEALPRPLPPPPGAPPGPPRGEGRSGGGGGGRPPGEPRRGRKGVGSVGLQRVLRELERAGVGRVLVHLRVSREEVRLRVRPEGKRRLAGEARRALEDWALRRWSRTFHRERGFSPAGGAGTEGSLLLDLEEGLLRMAWVPRRWALRVEEVEVERTVVGAFPLDLPPLRLEFRVALDRVSFRGEGPLEGPEELSQNLLERLWEDFARLVEAELRKEGRELYDEPEVLTARGSRTAERGAVHYGARVRGLVRVRLGHRVELDWYESSALHLHLEEVLKEEVLEDMA